MVQIRGSGLTNNINVAMVDSAQRLWVNATIDSATATLNVQTSAYVSGLVAVASSGNLVEVRGYNSGPAQWVHIFDSPTVPADTTVPVEIIKVPSDANFYITPPGTKAFVSGISVANSLSGAELVIGAADCWFEVDYTL